MPDRIRFHVDESCTTHLADALRRRGIDVTTTPQVGLIAARDLLQLEFATREGRVLITHDADFLRLHRQGLEHAGIVYCHQESRSLGEVLRGLLLVWELLSPEEMKGHVEFV